MGAVKQKYIDAMDWHHFSPSTQVPDYCDICHYAYKGIGQHRYDDVHERLEVRLSGLDRAVEKLKLKEIVDVKKLG